MPSEQERSQDCKRRREENAMQDEEVVRFHKRSRPSKVKEWTQAHLTDGAERRWALSHHHCVCSYKVIGMEKIDLSLALNIVPKDL
ncbi:hypothetical protein CgunFtcFv8_009211 [Champsocephalus gunnari]|uniref:Uncharacterized protein n=1 Tax=Champsocephalus gunnari TaxID=52237 RepID=A0AAN8H139_CHAGU|nr:hypothetical protein CgunFtcFv8_009211 [Champsocephalus gunnari]